MKRERVAPAHPVLWSTLLIIYTYPLPVSDVVMTAKGPNWGLYGLWRSTGAVLLLGAMAVETHTIHRDKTSGPLLVASETTRLRRKYATLSNTGQFKIYALARYDCKPLEQAVG